ncbi:cysteine--tRNA ligase [Lentilactobacillus kefiri]|uniref:Cysteine--tRNA ligase n=1 Tax=Lentilactobacillus kefiri TaxID=33962 RepID=A0A511DWY9_LENKE|nr:cysteine--tRNA ligase [Lentilactobacillus kefiri]MCJ2161461.1 cysteine--tRNA ligase [Lentilactobacillus kefiri]MCP9368398.1 cysteine--tRNA ligase [Lentilactobacillus kefiri]MDH5107787.1 cysteine--tRNA ligase [Lentilactobacillus kefiri]PAK59758.1 cysteine--tRNA ligase [Lentilactobacillus kefiri]PAK83416.1 cysteine--tRNA ligase [Lentilactobacillus kefiri]
MLQIFNTLTRKKEKFEPITPGVVKMYVCGPTVYNYIHIGNARSAIAFDTVRRYLEYRGYKVKYVSNFTDVDDKMINAARENHTTVEAIADKYIKAFMQDTAALNISSDVIHPRATQNIPEIIDFVKKLVDKGYAYNVDGDVYFRARKFPSYGALPHINVDQLEIGASQHVSSEEMAKKEDPIDFALWKKSKGDEISWDSPWGKGRPGWHIECSVMSTKYLGKTIDIHGGGEDLIFPHHENERAQSEANTGQTFVNYWMHNGFVTIGDDNEKMSKSLGNFITVHDLLKNLDGQVIRLLMSTTHYRRPIQYSDASVQEASSNLKKIQTAFNNLTYRLHNADEGDDPKTDQEVRQIVADFTDAMDDDFNVQNGIAAVYELAKFANTYSERETVFKLSLQFIINTLRELSGVFGIKLEQTELKDDEIWALIHEREQARHDKDFIRSDEIREELKARGIVLEDTPQGTRFRKE